MMPMTAQGLYGAQPVATPPASPSAEQIAGGGIRRNGGDRPRDNRREDVDVAGGQRALLLWVLLIGVAIALGWVSVTGAVRVGK